jgi:hypothetical protein
MAGHIKHGPRLGVPQQKQHQERFLVNHQYPAGGLCDGVLTTQSDDGALELVFTDEKQRYRQQHYDQEDGLDSPLKDSYADLL